MTENGQRPRGNRLLAETAYDAIKRDIIRCELEPGRQVTEEQLALRYGVGRAAVRAAVKRLYQEQFVQTVSRQRYVITPITLKYVNDLFDLRLLLEPAAAQRAAGRVDGEALRRLDELHRARYLIGDRHSIQVFLDANTEFHLTVAQASGNQLLSDTIAGVLDKVQRVQQISHLLGDRNEEAVHEHHDLIEALVAGDGERAKQVMTEQILAARTFVLEALLASPSLQLTNVVVL